MLLLIIHCHVSSKSPTFIISIIIQESPSQKSVVAVFAVRKDHADHVVCKYRGAAPPQSPCPFFEAFQVCCKEKASRLSVNYGCADHFIVLSHLNIFHDPNAPSFLVRPSKLAVTQASCHTTMTTAATAAAAATTTTTTTSRPPPPPHQLCLLKLPI